MYKKCLSYTTKESELNIQRSKWFIIKSYYWYLNCICQYKNIHLYLMAIISNTMNSFWCSSSERGKHMLGLYSPSSELCSYWKMSWTFFLFDLFFKNCMHCVVKINKLCSMSQFSERSRSTSSKLLTAFKFFLYSVLKL